MPDMCDVATTHAHLMCDAATALPHSIHSCGQNALYKVYHGHEHYRWGEKAHALVLVHKLFWSQIFHIVQINMPIKHRQPDGR